MKTVLSLAVLLLIGDASAERIYRNKHGKSYVQFLEGDFDDLSQDLAQAQETEQSVNEAEKQMGKQIKTDAETMNSSLDHYTKLNFDKDGETFSKATSVADNLMLELPTYYNPVPGVTMIQSDPIHGSLGEPKIKMKDLTPEQQFEESQRRKVPQVFKDDKEQVVDTDESIKWAEENTGGKMPEPVEKKKMKKAVKYTLHDSDDEEDDTVETRKSVKTAEKSLKKRFFINAKEKRDYEDAMAAGKISEKQLDFKEDEDEELGPVDVASKAKQAAKKQAKLQEIADKKAAKTAPKLTKEEKEAKEMEEAIAKSKEDRADNAAPEPKKKVEAPKVEAPPKAPTPSDLPPELAGALAQQTQRHRIEESDSDSDSDSSDSDDE